MRHNKYLFIVFFVCLVTYANGQMNSSIKPVLNAYLGVKEALVASNNEQTSLNATILVKALAAVSSSDLNTSTNTVWLKIANDLKTISGSIASANDIRAQRDYFVSLSSNMYLLVKEAKNDVPVYFQFCPMANKGKGANWLSLENKIKNPYYGAMMLSCGKVVETLQ
jgi:hypothetical protein